MVETLCTSGNVKLAAGANVSTELTPAYYTTLINQAESTLAADTLVNWVDAWPTISGNNTANIVQQAAANFAAVGAINYDPSGYTSLGEATTLINVCLDRYDRAVKLLKDANVYKPLGGGSNRLVE